ncbi:hypothetical protein PWT90_06115 [Aphanocladium album]|nr:hypothetical protein PWT90_06115 [Aphanocladium album]
MVESRGTSLACAVGLLYVWAVFAFGIRTWTKYRAKRWNIDDYTYTAAFIFAIVHAILVVNCIAHGYGRHVEDISEPDLEQIELLHYVGQFLYALSFGLGRISSALFVSIVAQASPLVWPARTVAALSGIWSIASVLCLGFDGNVGKPWTGIVTRPLFFRWLGIESIGMLLELSLFILSTSLILRLQMATSRRLYLVAAFGIRLSLIPIIAARLVYLQPSHNPMPTWSAITPALLTESALSLSIMTGVPAARAHFEHARSVARAE